MKMTRMEFVRGAMAAGAYGLAGRGFGLAAAVTGADGAAGLTLPSAAQRKWADMELGMMFSFDIIVYTPGWNFRSWKNQPAPALYNPAKLDTDQWMEAAKAYGAKYAVLVAKHCSGFLQWQSDLYPYGMKQSPWKGGKGDLVKDFVESARRYGIQPGLYASVTANGFLGVDNPGIVKAKGWLGGPSHEVQKRYVKICESMQEELFSRYGELFEIWFDGGILAPEKGGPDILPIIEKHQPNAILFQGPAQSKNNIRWVGNERGVAPYPCWATGRDITQSDGVKEQKGERFSGTPDGRKWIPGECDVPLGRNRWFCTTGVKNPYWSKDYLANMYDSSVGRNCNLLLNAAPQPDGLIKEEEMEIYREFGRIIKGRYENLLAKTEGEGDKIELAIPKDKGPINQVVLMERIERGERVREFALEAQTADGAWKRIYKGSCIGHKHIVRFEKTEADRLRLSVVKSADTPLIRDFSAYCN